MWLRKICLYTLYCSLPVLIHTPSCATLTVMDASIQMHEANNLHKGGISVLVHVLGFNPHHNKFVYASVHGFSKGGGLFLFLIWSCIKIYFSSHQFLMWKQHELAAGHCWNSKHPPEALFLGFVDLPAINIVHSILLYFSCYFYGVFLMHLALLWW